MTDPRPMISAKLKELETADEVWLDWPSPKCRIRLEKDTGHYYTNPWVLFVHKGRFGLGYFYDRNGPRCQFCYWADGGSGPNAIYVHDIRATVAESHPELST